MVCETTGYRTSVLLWFTVVVNLTVSETSPSSGVVSANTTPRLWLQVSCCKEGLTSKLDRPFLVRPYSLVQVSAPHAWTEMSVGKSRRGERNGAEPRLVHLRAHQPLPPVPLIHHHLFGARLLFEHALSSSAPITRSPATSTASASTIPRVVVQLIELTPASSSASLVQSTRQAARPSSRLSSCPASRRGAQAAACDDPLHRWVVRLVRGGR